MSEKYLELIKENIKSVFEDTAKDIFEIDKQHIIYIRFSDESKKKIVNYILENAGEYYIETLIPFISLGIHYLNFINELNKLTGINLSQEKEYVLVKYCVLPTYSLFVSEKIFGLKYPYEYTLRNIEQKAEILETIAKKLQVLDNDELKQYIIENVIETFVKPIENITGELLYNLPEFKALKSYLSEGDITDNIKIFTDIEKLKLFQEYLSKNKDNLLYPDYQIPEKVDKVFNDLEEIFKELRIQIRERRNKIHQSVNRYFIDLKVSDINNDFFRRYNLGVM